MSFAQQLTESGQVSAKIEQEKETKETTANWQQQLLGDGLGDSGKLRQGCPLSESSDHNWRFIHASLLDYFMTTTVVEQLLLPQDQATLAAHPLFTRSYDQAVALLTLRHLTSDQAQFLADRVRTNSTLKEVLWALLKRSKRDSHVAIASANAITVLKQVRPVFSNINLAGVRIPGADLTGSYWDQVNLTNADLSGVNLRHVWMGQCQL